MSGFVNRLSMLRFLLLAPSAQAAASFEHVRSSADEHQALLMDLQRFRGRIHIEHGSACKLTTDGRHVAADDPLRWHILIRSDAGQMLACMGLRLHLGPVRASQLSAMKLVLRSSPTLHERFCAAVDGLIAQASRRAIGFGEVGGWAVASDARHASPSLLTPLAAWAICPLIGHSLWIATAGVYHKSSPILQRMGAFRIADPDGELPPVYDPVVQDGIELLGFDSLRPGPAYAPMVQQLTEHLSRSPVVALPGEAERAAVAKTQRLDITV